MARYRVSGVVVGSKYLGVFEADTPEEAIEKALASEEALVGLCHECAKECEDPQINEAYAEAMEEGEDE